MDHAVLNCSSFQHSQHTCNITGKRSNKLWTAITLYVACNYIPTFKVSHPYLVPVEIYSAWIMEGHDHVSVNDLPWFTEGLQTIVTVDLLCLRKSYLLTGIEPIISTCRLLIQ